LLVNGKSGEKVLECERLRRSRHLDAGPLVAIEMLTRIDVHGEKLADVISAQIQSEACENGPQLSLIVLIKTASDDFNFLQWQQQLN
jgi:hypothetical protein